MKDYLKNEILKLMKSKYIYFIIVSTFLFQMIFCGYYLMYLPKQEGVFNFTYSVVMQMSLAIFIYEINGIVLGAFLFSKEYQDRTFMYVIIRPISNIKLFLSKVIIMLVLSILIFIFSFLSSSLIGYIFFPYTPFSISGIDFFMQDLNIVESFIRMILFSTSVIIGILLSGAISIIYSCLSKNFLGTIISSIVTFIIVAFPIQLKNGNYFSISSYQFPNYLMEKDFNTYLELQTKLNLLNIFVVIIIYIIGYKLMEKSRKKVL